MALAVTWAFTVLLGSPNPIFHLHQVIVISRLKSIKLPGLVGNPHLKASHLFRHYLCFYFKIEDLHFKHGWGLHRSKYTFIFACPRCPIHSSPQSSQEVVSYFSGCCAQCTTELFNSVSLKAPVKAVEMERSSKEKNFTNQLHEYVT